MITKDFKSALRLVNTLINEEITRWSDAPETGKTYMIRHTENSGDEEIELQPTYSDTFYNIEDYIHIAEVCGCSFYVCCKKNLCNVMTPTLHIY